MTSLYPERADPNRAAGRPPVQNYVNGLVPIPDRGARVQLTGTVRRGHHVCTLQQDHEARWSP